MIDKMDRMNQLLDIYKALLTEKQIETIELYYSNDLSLQEIADEANTSKNAVYDLIKRTSKLLEDYEAKLHLLDNYHKRIDIINRLLDSNDDRVIDLANKLLKLEESED